MDEREKRAVEEEIRALEAELREYKQMHPENTSRIQDIQNQINGKKAYIRGWS